MKKFKIDPGLIGDIIGLSLVMWFIGFPIFILSAIVFNAVSQTASALFLTIIKIVMILSGIASAPFVVLVVIFMFCLLVQGIKEHGVK